MAGASRPLVSVGDRVEHRPRGAAKADRLYQLSFSAPCRPVREAWSRHRPPRGIVVSRPRFSPWPYRSGRSRHLPGMLTLGRDKSGALLATGQFRGTLMSRRTGRVLAATLAVGLVLSLGSAALAAPVGALKQFKVPTANSQPRAITNGSDGNRWFTEGTEFTSAPAKIARITPAGVITEFAPDVADGCNFCIITDIAQGPGGILYITSNDPTLMRFNMATQSFETPVP